MVKVILLALIISFNVLNLKAQQLPERLNVKSLTGETIPLESITKDTTVVFMFWASWCKPCVSELEALKEIKDQWIDKFKLVAVSIDDARAVAKVRSIVKGKKWPFMVLLDNNQELYKALNLTSIPCALVVRNGLVVWKHYGYMPGNEDELLKQAYKAQQSK